MLDFTTDFKETFFSCDGVNLFCRHTRHDTGLPVLLLHGHTQTSAMWAPLANQLAANGQRVAALDLHGLGQSDPAPGRYDKRLMAKDFKTIVEKLFGEGAKVAVVGHDLGAFAAYAFAARYPSIVHSLVLMDATVPGLGIWPLLLQQPRTWHFGFYGSHAVQLVDGRARNYLDRFWDEFALNPAAITEDMREHYSSCYDSAERIESAFSHFEAFGRDAADNQASAKAPLQMRILGLGGSHSLGDALADHLPLLGSDVSSGIIDSAGHWLIEENPEQTINRVTEFILR